jgi:predicted RNA-binding Zn ribbon-like protein
VSGAAIPEDEYRFHWLSGRLCLNFVTTVGERWRRSFDRLRQPSDLARWFGDAGLTRQQLTVSDADLKAARTLREAIYRSAKAAMSQKRPSQADQAILNRFAARSPGAVALTLSPAGMQRTIMAPTASAALSDIARDAIDLLASPLRGRIRQCSAADCALIYLDTSRAATRRWCSMDLCGNRVKTARYRRRQRTSRVA